MRGKKEAAAGCTGRELGNCGIEEAEQCSEPRGPGLATALRALSEVRKEQLVGFFSCCVAAL